MFYYITVKASPQYRQMTLDDLLFGTDDFRAILNPNETNTVTYQRQEFGRKFNRIFEPDIMTIVLEDFNEKTAHLREVSRNSLYNTFYIPKKSGGLRRIDAPNDELSRELRYLWNVLDGNDLLQHEQLRKSAPWCTYHTSAFAYVKGRCAVDAVKRHQANESNWFAKFDIHNFFGATTPEFLMSMMARVFPYCEVMKTARGEAALRTAIDLCFKDGGLPQGTPISPFLTNLMMIPLDFEINKRFREEGWAGPRMVYTRYADDFLISSRKEFRFRDAEDVISGVLREFGAPFSLNSKKTRYGSRAGANWNLGVMLNKDNEITVGHKKKKQFQNMLHSYCMDKQQGVAWDPHDIMVMEGLRSYYKNIEGEAIDRIVSHVGGKFGIDIPAEIRRDLKL